MLVLLFAGWIIFSLFRIVRRSAGPGAAWLAVLTLAGIAIFPEMSVRVMIGLPAVAFALAGIDHALSGAKSGAHWRFLLAGILIALGLQTKLFVGLMLPAALIAPFVERWTQPLLRRRAFLDLAILLGSIIVTFSIIAVVAGEPIFEQLISPHVKATNVEEYAAKGGFLFVLSVLTPYPAFPK